METITITLNGREVSGQPGMTILDLARETGVYIPTLCYDPNLASYGACRICIVEDERTGALMASCVTPLAPGMNIKTDSPRVIERRQTIIKLLLASHPDTCIVCDKGNCCQLRQIATDMGIGWIDLQRIPQLAAVEEVNPFIQRDLSKCILCAKCIRADQELVVVGCLDYIKRGFTAKPATLNDQPLENSECTFCGTCIAMCPTGALAETEKSYRGATNSLIASVCPYCGCGCGISLHIKDGQVIRVQPDQENPLNRGTLCVRGSYGYDFISSPDRIKNPLVKINDKFEETTWEKALQLVAQELQRIKQGNGPDSLAVLGSSKCTNEDNFLIQKFARSVLETNNIDNGSILYNTTSQATLLKVSGSPWGTGSLDDLEKSEAILVAGANPSSSAPLVEYAIKRAVKYRNARLIIIDPQQNNLTPFAHLWLKPELDTYNVLLHGIARMIIENEGLLKKGYMDISSRDFAELKTSLINFNADYVSKITGITSEQLSEAASLLATAKQASVVWGSGISQTINAVDSIQALINLAILTGNTNRILVLQKENNGLGACDMGALPDYLPGYYRTDSKTREIFEKYWKCALPTDGGLNALAMIDGIRDHKVKGMYIVGENPVRSLPDMSMVKQTLKSLEFLVVQDMFLTETAELATVVLPAASFAEREGTFTNFEGKIQKLRKAIEPVGNSQPDWQIVTALANKFGHPWKYESAGKIFGEISELSALCAAASTERSQNGTSSPPTASGRAVLTNKLLFKWDLPSKMTLSPADKASINGKRKNASYPFTLIAESTLFHFGTGVRSSRSLRLHKFVPEALVQINETDARNLGIGQGNKVKIASAVGEIIAKVSITKDVESATIIAPMSFPGTPVNSLFEGDHRKTQNSLLKTCSVKLERIENV